MAKWTCELPIVNGIATATVEAKDEREALEKIKNREFIDVGNAQWDVDETKPVRLKQE